MSDFPIKSTVVRRWQHAGLDCVITTGPGRGWCNGYVRVPKDHVAFGAEYQRPPVKVHGGLTYGSDDGWFGFDTAHGGDTWSDEALAEVGLPPAERYTGLRGGDEWALARLVDEVESLADQFASMTTLGRADAYSITDDELTALYDEIDRYRAGGAS